MAAGYDGRQGGRRRREPVAGRGRHGDHERATALLCDSLRLRNDFDDPWGTALCLEILAWSAAAEGRRQRAARLFGACHALYALTGSAVAHLGPFRESHVACEREVCEALGEHAYADAFRKGADLTLSEAIAYALAEHRGGPRPAPSAPATGPLTRREREIAELVARGMSNRDIAGRLVISQRTVESHVEHVLAKLGFTARTQIASWVTERDSAST